ncbi:type II toxin-antitoxin system VapC family toxin [Sphingobium sp.]|uniref:type II toxin-antitoxin system VapC family toxin n=1 Tax=Sphingobium sp. TaxID=1912891 RepID=UPI0028BEBF2F|nr:type II toxin-antitoxin system VapC family toxin [Sphingobium sp.]
MKVVADTNILVRAGTQDHPVQGPIARDIMAKAQVVAVALPALCEFCWVLRTAYRFSGQEIAYSLRLLLAADNVATDREAAEAGLAILDAGGDFADGVIAHMGRWLGGETFVSFDKEAVRLLQAQGEEAQIPA